MRRVPTLIREDNFYLYLTEQMRGTRIARTKDINQHKDGFIHVPDFEPFLIRVDHPILANSKLFIKPELVFFITPHCTRREYLHDQIGRSLEVFVVYARARTAFSHPYQIGLGYVQLIQIHVDLSDKDLSAM